MAVSKLSPNPINQYINRLSKETINVSNGIPELFVLSKIIKNLPIIIRNDTEKITHIIDNGVITKNPTSSVISKYDPKKCVNIRFDFITSSDIPNNIIVIYYKN